MTSTRQRVKELREERGWTQQDVADQVARLAWLRRHERAGVNADMVAKWERGEKRPSPRYRELLCLLFGVDAQTLGIGVAVQPLAGVRSQAEESTLIATLGGAASLLDQLGAAGAILQPRMFGVWKDELMHRRAMLKLIGLATTTGFASLADADSSPSGKPTPETVQDLDHLADRYQAMYHSTAPTVLMTPVLAHLETIRDLLRQGGDVHLRRKLFANRARVATLAGRLAFFDLRDPLTARGYYNLALESAREAGEHLQAAAALAHMAFIPAADFSFSAALDYLRSAAQHVAKRPDSRVASWLYAVESEIQTNAGAHAAALAAIERALATLDKPGLPAALPWFDYYDATRLSGFAGYATLRAGRFEESRTALTGALEHMPRTAVKQRAVFLTDIASVDLAGVGEYLNGHDLYPDARPCLQALKGAGYFVGVAGNQTARAGRFLRELNLPCDVLATSDNWGVAKPDLRFFGHLAGVTGYPASEIAYVGDRLDNDITPAALSGLFTVWIRRGPWGYVLRPGDPSPAAAPLPDGAPSLMISTLDELPARLATDRL